jgi:parvulin-like peptidyl-prolyl isomerase
VRVIYCCAVLELVLGRFPSDPSILLTFAQHALSSTTDAAAAAAANAAATSDADAAADRSSYALQLEQLVLQVLESHERPCAAVKADQVLSGQLHVLLYNQGALKFEEKRFDAAVRFLTASLDFAEVRAALCVYPC